MKIGIIGAGASGLAGIRICKEYGFEPVCIEKTHDIGGLWRYKPEECEGEASVMKTTVINTSKEMTAYSDFPPPKDFPNFMHNTRLMDYFRLYAEQFDLLRHIRFGTDVLDVKRTEDYDATGKWSIHCREKSGEEYVETVDGVLLCSGHHVEPYLASFPGLEKFEGKVLHSHSYKDHKGFEDKNVLIIGIGNSGGDIAVELSRISKQVYLATRRGSWVFNRVGDRGYPLDCIFSSRLAEAMRSNFLGLTTYLAETQLSWRFDHGTFGLKPAHRVFQAHPTVNDDLPNRILCGTIVVKPNVRRFTESGALFEDGSVVEGLDAVVLATGYSFSFPYLEGGELVPVKENDVQLYKWMFPTNLPHPSAAIIGLIQPLGSIMPISEMQCRVFCEGMAGGLRLPMRALMEADVRGKKRAMAERYVSSRRHTIQVDYIGYMDELAGLIGARPDLLRTWLSDPRLAAALTFGPVAAYHYRLAGPHPWPGARNAILTLWDRVLYPTKTREIPPPLDAAKSGGGGLARNLAYLALAALLLYLFFALFF